MDNNLQSEREVLSNVLDVIDNIYAVYWDGEGFFEQFEELYEMIVLILARLKNCENKFEGEVKWKERNANIEELLENVKNIKFYLLFELQEFCLVQRSDPMAGIGSYILTNLNSIVQCLQKSKIPVIDMCNGKNPFYYLRGVENGWEAFFEQPFSVKLADVKLKENLPICSINSENEFVLMDDFYNRKELQTFWHKMYKKYMRFTPEVKEYIEKEHLAFFENIDIKKVCGILCRGSDLTTLKPPFHWEQPSVEEVIEKAKTVMKDYRCQYIFLATEEKKIYDRFCEEFGEKNILVTKTHMVRGDEAKYITQMLKEENTDIFQNNLDYLSALYQLSTLKYFLAGRTSGTQSVFFMSEGFEYTYIWNKGRYLCDSRKELDQFEKMIL